VATKFAALPFQTKASDVVKACEKSVARLGTGRPIDLYQIHFPNAWSNAEYWDGLAMAYDKGLVKAVGVSNYGIDAIRACHDALAKRGIPLASNQIQLSLLYTHPIENGLLTACDDLGVKVLSYSPLALGMLTGKYTADNPPKGPRKSLFQSLQATPDYDNLLATMKDIASAHGNATPSQVALNWTRAKKTIPIPGARTLSQVQQNYAALDWDLSSAEVAALDKAAAKVTSFIKPEASPFPKEDINTHLKMFDS
jgi:pyridoxine 4-dehydrogenase